MQTLPVKDDFPPPFFEEFARLVVVFGRLEYLIKLCVKDLLGQGFSQGMAEAESRRQFSKLCEEATAQAAQRLTQAQSDAFSGLIAEAKSLADYRNDTIHALWTTDSNGQPLRIRPKKGVNKQLVDWSGSRVVLVSEIQSKREHVERLYLALEAERRTWSISAT